MDSGGEAHTVTSQVKIYVLVFLVVSNDLTEHKGRGWLMDPFLFISSAFLAALSFSSKCLAAIMALLP